MNKLSSVVLSIALALILVVGVAFILRGIIDYKQLGEKIIGLEPTIKIVDEEPEENMLIGGQKDEHGCLDPAGYSWCEAKEKCLRTWEEPCTTEDALRNYLKDNLSELSPEPEVLGGTFYVTEVKLEKPTQAIVDYEDGHNAYRASVLFTYDNEIIEVKKFSLIAENPPAVGNDNIAVIELKKLFAEKYDLMEEDIRIEMSDERATYLRGNVWLFPDSAGNNLLFLAAMVDGQYELAYDGQGNYTCALVEAYSFPEDMVSDCLAE